MTVSYTIILCPLVHSVTLSIRLYSYPYSNAPASPSGRGSSNMNDSVGLTPSNDSFDSLWMEDGFEYDITFTGKMRRQLYRILCVCADYIKSWTTSYCL